MFSSLFRIVCRVSDISMGYMISCVRICLFVIYTFVYAFVIISIILFDSTLFLCVLYDFVIYKLKVNTIHTVRKHIKSRTKSTVQNYI